LTKPADGGVDAAPLLAELKGLREAMEQQNEQETSQQRAFDQLYEELKQYKEDFIYQMEKPLLLDLLLFYDSMNWFQQSLVKKDLSPDVIADSFQYLIDEFLELLYRRDVIPMETPDKFDRKIQKAIKTVETPNPAEDNTIHQILKRGFLRGGRLLRAEEVVIQKHPGNAHANT
jgi:molecular chaperone GrpE (heat shock protein)